MTENITLEICAGSYQDALTADRFSIDRIELNSALELGGLTPSAAEFKLTRKASSHRIICMVRPRPSGFVYSDSEFEVMYQDADYFLNQGADGIVFGALNADHTVNRTFTEKMVKLIHSYHKEAVFHKAFDETPDPDQAMNDLISCGICRVLTSGQKSSVTEGAELLHHLQMTYSSQIEILPGGGVSADNILDILNITGCTQMHFSAKSEFTDIHPYYAVDARKINAIMQKLNAKHRTYSQGAFMTGEDIAMIQNDSYESAMNSFDDDRNERK